MSKKRKLANLAAEIGVLVMEENYEAAQGVTQNLLFLLQETTGIERVRYD